jgi:hypothetical protein
MKKSNKIIAILTVVLLAVSINVKAQTSTSAATSGGIIYSVGIESSLSVGEFNKQHKGSLGGSIQADIPIAKQWYVNVNTGYDNYYGRKDFEGIAPTGLRIIPAMAGVKYFPVSGIYLQVDAGAAFLTNKSDLGYSRSSAFVYAPEVGVRLPVGDKSFIDAGVRYEEATRFDSSVISSKLNVIGLRLAYAFSL